MARSWDHAASLLTQVIDAEFAGSPLMTSAWLKPCSFTADWSKVSTMGLSDSMKASLTLGRLNLLADFKDVQLIYRFLKIYELIIGPAIAEVLVKLTGMLKTSTEEALERLQSAVEKRVYQSSQRRN